MDCTLLLVSQGVAGVNDTPKEFSIVNGKVIEDLSELHETFLNRVHADYIE
jgi:hypothetical protein